MSVRQIDVRPWALRHIAPSFNLIQDGCRQGHFTRLFLQPRYMAGLGLQLFCLLAGRIRLPDGVWYRARAYALQVDGAYAGFTIIRSAGTLCEIYMCAVADEYRGCGLGQAMLAKALAMGVQGDAAIVADCLPDSRAMMALLLRLGFHRRGGAQPGAAIRFVRAGSGGEGGPHGIAGSRATPVQPRPAHRKGRVRR